MRLTVSDLVCIVKSMLELATDTDLRITIHERNTWRAMTYAALDQLRAAHQEIERQRRQIAEMREERARWARSVFNE